MINLLQELSLGWDVALSSHEVGPNAVEWRLTITRYEQRDEGSGCDVRAFTYRGADLSRVISAAYGGEPSGTVS